MSKIFNVAAFACALFLISVGAMAQIRDPSIPAGTPGSVLSGTPSGTYGGSMAPRTVPSLGYTAPTVTGRSSGCDVGLGSCGSIIAPLHRHHHRL